MKNITFLLAAALALVSCRSVKVDEDNFAWKSFEGTDLDQSVELASYESPNKRLGQDKDQLVILCASGGGSRAASFNIGIMMELEKLLYMSSADSAAGVSQPSNLLNEIDYFSTVSGGGWGVSSYIAYKYQQRKYSSPQYLASIGRYNIAFKDKEGFEPILPYPTFNSFEKVLATEANSRYYRRQLFQLLNVWRGFRQSDRILTERLNDGYLGRRYREDVDEKLWTLDHPKQKFRTPKVDEVTLGDVFVRQGTPWLPMQIANTVNIDNFMLVPFTPDRLKTWGTYCYNHYNLKLKHLDDRTKIASYDEIPLASGTKASSGIPFLVACASYPSIRQDRARERTEIKYNLHLQDGGMVDQQAMHSAKAILRYHSTMGDITDPKKRIVFIVDASGKGIRNTKRYKWTNAGRWYNMFRVMSPFSVPDSQYALTRERIRIFQLEYNCTVIYLGTEVLIDPKFKRLDDLSTTPTKKYWKWSLEKCFFKEYDQVQDGTLTFDKTDMAHRKLLYSYVSRFIRTTFSSKLFKNDEDQGANHIENASSKIMFLAGRGVVQLRAKDIKDAFGIK